MIRIEALDWNCQQHIFPRFTEEEIGEALAPLEKRMQGLEEKNKKLRGEIVRLTGRERDVHLIGQLALARTRC